MIDDFRSVKEAVVIKEVEGMPGRYDASINYSFDLSNIDEYISRDLVEDEIKWRIMCDLYGKIKRDLKIALFDRDFRIIKRLVKELDDAV